MDEEKNNQVTNLTNMLFENDDKSKSHTKKQHNALQLLDLSSDKWKEKLKQ
jgi:hypothetical protein